jgi:polyether ionophore transport system permease protein
MPRDSRASHNAKRVVALLTARRFARPAALWGAVSGGYVVYAAWEYSSSYPTAASREKVALTFGTNAGLSALLGEGQRLATIAGFTAWRAMGVLVPVGAVWAMLAATRLTRGEEDAGRLELLLAGWTTRRRAAVQEVAGLAAGLTLLWAITAVAAVIAGSFPKVGIPAPDALFLATAVITGPAMFAGVGVLAAQLVASRRQANGVAAAAFGASLLIRVVADATPGLHWLRWLSPFGWAEQLHPLTSPAPAVFLPIVAFTAVLVAGAIFLAARRDMGTGALPARDAPPSRTRLLHGPTGLACRLDRPAIIGWAAGLAILGLVGGLVAPSAAKAISNSPAILQTIGRLGARPGSAAYLGIIYLAGAALTCFAAAGQIAATRGEEAEGYIDHLLARPVSRWRWMTGRLAVSAGLVIIVSLAAGLAGWAGIADQHTGLSFAQFVKAGLNIAPPALFVLGAGALCYGTRPRLAPALTYGLVAWSFLIELLATVVTNRWLLDTSVLHHIQPVPAAQPNWTTAAWLTGLAILAALAGTALFSRRDLAGA